MFTRYILLEWEKRKQNDSRTIGNLFLCIAEEIDRTRFTDLFSTMIEVMNTMGSENRECEEIFIEFIARLEELLPEWLRSLLHAEAGKSLMFKEEWAESVA